MAVKLIFCCRRRPELSLEEFHQTWLNDHGPLVRKCHEQLPQMKRYVQSHLIAGPASDAVRASRGSGEPYDGITEVWFDSLEAMGANTSAEAIAAGEQLLADERRMLDLPRCSVFLAVEHEIF